MRLPNQLLERHRWLVFLLPFVVYSLVGGLEPTPDKPGGGLVGLSIPYSYYPWLYAAKIALTTVAVVLVLPGYREFPLRLGLLAVVVGIVGGPLWIGLCQLDFGYVQPALRQIGLGSLVGSGQRPGFNPLVELAGNPGWAWGFLAIRFFGLVVAVPVMEEFFLRGFVMRFFVQREWWNVPFGKADGLALVLGTAVPMLMHPGELLAAAVWFSMITWLMLRTRNIWDCIVAHAITNLILGIYVVHAGGDAWRLM